MKHDQKRKEQLAIGAMTLAAMIWGSAFIVVRMALNAGLSTSQILFFRFGLTTAVFAILFRKDLRKINRTDLLYGLSTGIILFLGFWTQTLALRQTTPARNAFITSTYVVIVPLLGWLILRQKPALRIILGACLSLVGIGLLSLDGAGGSFINGGDVLTFICAICFAGHFLMLEWSVHRVNTNILLFLQMAATTVCSLLLLPFDHLFESASAPVGDLGANWVTGLLAILYLAIFSSGVAYFIQTTAQKYTSSSKAAIVLAAEALWGSFFSLLFGFETLTLRLAIGGLIIFASILLVEWPAKGYRRDAV